ncbi:hypothetical protein DMB66_32675 [Actinoplanes sp. ATCC 53533]|uniref:hypothetical protein n=1 Tax=Actinoplanes sp. ATCC 53533 TaxID=1288362 RepID=UPI000F7B1119|nr:hypothetical protein [Actinoplanes sp. ATCC 53533]RSM56833.1 hypothetical protein DMB66_32675 [Actinoplanes sp. ATCC 53533]
MRAAQSLSACSSLAVGVFGWLIAHLLTLLLLTHSHGGTLSLAVRGLHDYTTAATVLAGGIAAISLLVMPVSASMPSSSDPGPPRRGRTVRRFVAMSTLAFVAAQLGEHTLLDGVRMPPAILLAGVLLHALFGTVGALTWHHYYDLLHRLWSPTRSTTATIPTPLQHTSVSVWGPRRPLFDSCVTGRAPPAAVTA